MSRRYDILYDIARWSAKRELPQQEVVELVHRVLDDAGQSSYDFDNDMEVEKEMESIRKSVADVYAKTLGYEVHE